MPQVQPTLLDAIDFASCLKARISFLDLSLHSSRLQDVLDDKECEGLFLYLSDLFHNFECLEAQLDAVFKGGQVS